jgi:hypothetical protein
MPLRSDNRTFRTSSALRLSVLLILGPVASCAHGRADARPRIEKAMRTEVEPLRGRDEVAAYLEKLRVRAVSQHQVTALEVEPGVAAIEKLEPEIGSDATQEWIARFVQSMAELSRGEK